LQLATQTNAIPLPPIPEVFGVRLPPLKDCLTSVDFDLVPNKPPPTVQLYEEEIVEETDDDEEEGDDDDDEMEELDVTAAVNNNDPGGDGEGEGSDADALFEGEDDALATDVHMASTTPDPQAPTIARKLVEDDDYD